MVLCMEESSVVFIPLTVTKRVLIQKAGEPAMEVSQVQVFWLTLWYHLARPVVPLLFGSFFPVCWVQHNGGNTATIVGWLSRQPW